MSEKIYKLQPNRTMHLRGFDRFGAAAAMWGASETGFTVSGVFRDQADFAVLMLWDADNFFEHPRMKYLPDFDFSELTLSFDVRYTNLQPLDSDKYPTIDWPYLDVIREDGIAFTVALFSNPELVAGQYTAASITLTLAGDPTPGSTATIWFRNSAWQYFVPQGVASKAFAATGIAGTEHTLTIQEVTYTYVEVEGDTNTSVTAGVLAAAEDDPWVTLEIVGAGNQIDATAAVPGVTITVEGEELKAVTLPMVATALAEMVNGDLDAVANDLKILVTATKPGEDGNLYWIYAETTGDLKLTGAGPLGGGSSDATWRITLDFAALQMDRVRQMWMTFAPRIQGGPYKPEEWEAVFSNWQMDGPEEKRRLQVAGPGSVRVEETDRWCRFEGTWASQAGFYSEGFARVTNTPGDSVTVEYCCGAVHDLYLGTSLYLDRGQLGVSIDGGEPVTVDLYLPVSSEIVTRRRIQAAMGPGRHTVTMTVLPTTSYAGHYCYFDFLEAAVLSDVPDPPEALVDVAPATDYDTDHGYKLPPQRLMAIYDNLGYGGPIDQYVGVFWWNQRVPSGGVFPEIEVEIGGEWEAGDQIFIRVGATTIGKTVFAGEDVELFAQHFEWFINETFSGVCARAEGNLVRITSLSAGSAYQFDQLVWAESAKGTITYSGSLAEGTLPEWVIDPDASPVMNRAARDWHADLYKEVAARGQKITSAFSMELVNPPAAWVARFYDGTPVETATGFSTLVSNHCAPMQPEFLAYQQRAFSEVAGLQAEAGLTPSLQCGEFLWWFFSHLSTMAYHDAATVEAAFAALGRPLHVFWYPDDDPSVNEYADAEFLRSRLRDHVQAIRTCVQATWPAAEFEVLYAYDVNHPHVYGPYALGGRLNHYVNTPPEWMAPEAGYLEGIRIEGLDFGSGSRDLNRARQAIALATAWGWPKEKARYILPVNNGGCPWPYELAAARGAVAEIALWALDHVCLFGWDVRKEVRPAAFLT